MQRYDIVTNYRCGQSVEEMEKAEDGEWMRVPSCDDCQHQIAHYAPFFCRLLDRYCEDVGGFCGKFAEKGGA